MFSVQSTDSEEHSVHVTECPYCFSTIGRLLSSRCGARTSHDRMLLVDDDCVLQPPSAMHREPVGRARGKRDGGRVQDDGLAGLAVGRAGHVEAGSVSNIYQIFRSCR